MLNPSLIVNAAVTTLATIPDLVTAMANDPTRIQGFHFVYGSDQPLRRAIYEMRTPGILVVWEGSGPGRSDGQTLWKHRLGVYIRMGNAGAQVAAGQQPVTYEQLWWMIVNSPVNNGTQCIRKVSILTGLQIMDTPSIGHLIDEDGGDYFAANFVFPEIGDN